MDKQTGAKGLKKPVYYMQTDPKWSDINYSAKGEHTTIGRAGCGPTSAAMVLASWKDKKITPKETAAWAVKHGYKAPGQGTYYSYFAALGKAYGISITMLNAQNLREISKNGAANYHKAAATEVKKGNWIIACMGPGLWTHGGHYILWYGIDDSHVLINDPASKAPERRRAPISVFRSQVKYYFLCKKPSKK